MLVLLSNCCGSHKTKCRCKENKFFSAECCFFRQASLFFVFSLFNGLFLEK